MRKVFYSLVVLVAVLLLFYSLRVPVLRSFSNLLIDTEQPEKSDVIFVLSGAAYDRGMKAMELYRRGLAPLVVCTGGNLDGNMLALGREYPECELTRSALLTNGVDSGAVSSLPQGTSTDEEAQAIETYCKAKNVRRCIVVTSAFHTRRVHYVVEKKLERLGVETYLVGAPSRFYNPNEWWKSENGLIELNNEYVKLFYYLLKGKL